MIPKLKMTEHLFADHAQAIEGILREAARRAMLEHKRAGVPVVTWRDDKIVMLQPEEISVDENDTEEA